MTSTPNCGMSVKQESRLAKGGWENHYILKGVYYVTLLFYSSNVEHLKQHRGSEATVDVQGCVYMHRFYGGHWCRVASTLLRESAIHIHIGVGFEVAYLNDEASSTAWRVR